MAKYGLSEFMEAKARRTKAEVPSGYGYTADVALGVGFFTEEKNQVKVLEDPVKIPSGDLLMHGYAIVYAYCTKDGVESLLSGQMPPQLPCTKKEPTDFGSLAQIADNFGSKDTSKKMDYCVCFRVPADLANPVEGAGVGGRDIWIVRFDNDAVSPLLEAAKNGNTTKVNKLLDSGLVKATAMDEQGVSALMMAACEGHLQVCQTLIKNGADVNHAEVLTKKTALMFAAQAGHASIVELLLNANADASKLDNEGCTALMWAATAGRKDVAALLVAKAPATKAAKNAQGQTAMDLADKMGHKEALKVMGA